MIRLSAGHRRLTGFTLMELMFVVGIIVIVGIVVAPGLKKAYDGYNVTKTVEEARSLLNSVRSYYLTYNELPVDQDPGLCEKKFSYFIPSYFFAKTEKTLKNNGRGYDLVIKPYGGTSYDLDTWYGQNDLKTTSVTMYFPTQVARDRVKSKLFALYPESSNDDNAKADGKATYALCWFLSEVNGNPDTAWH